MELQKHRSDDIVILAEGGERRLLQDAILNGPFIGIWWEDRRRIVAILQRADDASGGTSLLDSDFAHADEWPAIAHFLDKTPEDEYFIASRGRVLFDQDQGIGILYHGNATSAIRLQQIADLFGLTAWKSQTDEHYLTGDSVEDLFRQE